MEQCWRSFPVAQNSIAAVEQCRSSTGEILEHGWSTLAVLVSRPPNTVPIYCWTFPSVYRIRGSPEYCFNILLAFSNRIFNRIRGSVQFGAELEQACSNTRAGSLEHWSSTAGILRLCYSCSPAVLEENRSKTLIIYGFETTN